MEAEESSAVYIVLVDDEVSVLGALRLLLQALGFKVADFVDSNDALDYIRGGGSCDLFICDKQMRHADGIKVLGRCKRLRPALPFVLMSGAVTEEESAEAFREGASAFLAKPFSPEEIKALVARLVPRPAANGD